MSKTRITQNVLKHISDKIGLVPSPNNKVIVIFNGTSVNIKDELDYLIELKNNGYEISIGFSFLAENILDFKKIVDTINPKEIFKEEDVYKLKNIVNDYNMIISPNMTINTLSKISLGIVDSFIPNIIWAFLYCGKIVYINYNYIRNYMGEKPHSNEISEIVENHILTISKMGALEFTGKDILNKISLKQDEISLDKLNKNKAAKNLITLKDILLLDKNTNRLELDKSTIITPLAKDKARELGIKIQIK